MSLTHFRPIPGPSSPPPSEAGSETYPLEVDPEIFRSWVERATAYALDHLGALREGSALGQSGAEALEVAEQVSVAIPEEGLAESDDESYQAALERFAEAVPASFNTAGPGYLAYIPGGGLPLAAIADLLANLTNRFTGHTPAAPALARLEADVLRWLCREFGYGDEAYGLLTPGGSLANFTAFFTARVDRLGDEGDYRDAVAYTSAQAHHSVVRSLGLVGIPRRNLRVVPTDARFRMRPDALREAMEEDRAAGKRPFLVVAAAGSTNSGAIDPMRELAEICAEFEAWLHIDAAYGGAFVLCEEGRRRLAGIECADSITFDPHKGMFLPYGTGCLLVRDGTRLRHAHQGGAEYLQDLERFERAGEAPSPTEHGPELSRDFRGLRLWLPLMVHGARAFREALAEKLELAERFDAGLRALVERELPIEIVDAPQLSLSTFRLRRRLDETVEAWNERNAAWLESINARGSAYLSSTMLPLRAKPDTTAYTLRACILSFRTHADRIDDLLRDIAATCPRG